MKKIKLEESSVRRNVVGLIVNKEFDLVLDLDFDLIDVVLDLIDA